MTRRRWPPPRNSSPLTGLIRAGGARLVLVGDPHQSHPVGAGGLWPHLEQIAGSTDAHAELTRNVRAHDPADRRDQALFRAGEHDTALAGYQDRGRLHAAADRTAIEDAALDAAQIDREAGRRTVVITQTSNDHLDALNARAQAIRLVNGELGEHALELDGRPYGLRAGDDIQIRRTIHHAVHGPLRNGTPATVTQIDADTRTATVELPDGRSVELREDQLGAAQARLAYVQHPFPAQGTTVDTAHVIVGEHVTRQGTYVGLTRGRDRTDIYHPTTSIDQDDQDTLADLARHVGRDEHESPSIAFAMALRLTPTREGLESTAGFDGVPKRRWPRVPEPGTAVTPSRMRHEEGIAARENDQGWEP
jgi:ATP-dependent exoDNAse (exonuclease V) alpha subunit